MVEGRTSWEDGLADEDLSQDASNAPNVRCFPVGVGSQKDLRGSVPPSGYLLSEDDVVAVFVGNHGPGESEVADLHGAVAVEDEVGGLEVAMDDLGRVEILHALDELVEDEPVVGIFQNLLSE